MVTVPSQYQSIVQGASQQYGVPYDLLAGVIQSESSFNPNAFSSAGARGIAQFIPSTAAAYGVDTSDPTSSIYGAAHYISDLRGQYGSYSSALSAYVSGNPGYNFPSSNSYVKTGTIALAQQYDATGTGSGTLTIPDQQPNSTYTPAYDPNNQSTIDWSNLSNPLGPVISAIPGLGPLGTALGFGGAIKQGAAATGLNNINIPGLSTISNAIDSVNKTLGDPSTWARVAIVIVGLIVLFGAILLLGLKGFQEAKAQVL